MLPLATPGTVQRPPLPEVGRAARASDFCTVKSTPFTVSFESSVELVFRHGCERQAAASVGVRENDVKLSRGLLDVGKQTIEMSEFAGVGLYRHGVMPYFAFRHFKFFLSSPGDKHARAFLGEPLSSRQADSSRTASHENIPRGK
jgi:hypothetical protein